MAAGDMPVKAGSAKVVPVKAGSAKVVPVKAGSAKAVPEKAGPARGRVARAKTAKDAVGQYGERVARAHLVAAGMQVLDQNWRCRWGELDLVARDGECLVVCEVKTRRSMVCGGPLAAVTPQKLLRLRRLTALWLAEQGGGFRDVRIDVVAVMCATRGAAQVVHLRGVG
jgi:putative endonuclease